MAVSLALNYVERNDNKILTLTDISTGWGTPAGSSITTLDLYISITTSGNTTTDYDKINLLSLGAPITNSTTQSELVFVIDCTDLKVLGSPLGDGNTVLPDGIYEFKYVLNNGLGTASTLDEFVLMEGDARNAVYLALRNLPTLYMCKDCKSKQIMDAIFAYGMLNSIRAGGYVAKTEELISQLYVLERLLEYGSSYTW
jgi:hypothetical protein